MYLSQDAPETDVIIGTGMEMVTIGAGQTDAEHAATNVTATQNATTNAKWLKNAGKTICHSTNPIFTNGKPAFISTSVFG